MMSLSDEAGVWLSPLLPIETRRYSSADILNGKIAYFGTLEANTNPGWVAHVFVILVNYHWYQVGIGNCEGMVAASITRYFWLLWY
jgi:hypothetical protein